jgi:hypothetical protein
MSPAGPPAMSLALPSVTLAAGGVQPTATSTPTAQP